MRVSALALAILLLPAAAAIAPTPLHQGVMVFPLDTGGLVVHAQGPSATQCEFKNAVVAVSQVDDRYLLEGRFGAGTGPSSIAITPDPACVAGSFSLLMPRDYWAQAIATGGVSDSLPVCDGYHIYQVGASSVAPAGPRHQIFFTWAKQDRCAGTFDMIQFSVQGQ